MTRQTGSTATANRPKASSAVPGNTLGLKTADLAHVTRMLKKGLPYHSLVRLQKRSGLPLETIVKVVQIPGRMLARRKASGRLTSYESDRLLRLALIFEKTVALFEGDKAAACQWLNAPNKSLAGVAPLTMTETEIGGREVEDLIGRLEHGVFM